MMIFIAKPPNWSLKSQKKSQSPSGAGQKEVEPDPAPLEPKWGVQGLWLLASSSSSFLLLLFFTWPQAAP
jgi:hypothetical protein